MNYFGEYEKFHLFFSHSGCLLGPAMPPTMMILAHNDYVFGGETALRIRADRFYMIRFQSAAALNHSGAVRLAPSSFLDDFPVEYRLFSL